MRFTDFVTQKLYFSVSVAPGMQESEATPPLNFSLEIIKKNPTASRCLNMIVDAAASIDYEVKDGKKMSGSFGTSHAPTIEDWLNRKANKHMDASFFKRSIIMDLLTNGNAFIYVDKEQLFYMPAEDVVVKGDGKNLVTGYELGKQKFKPEEVIHIKDNTVDSIRRGQTRLKALTDIIDLHTRMKKFQKNFFSNNAMPGIILTSPNTLTTKLKQRKLQEWQQDFNPTSGARKPAFLDGGIKAENVSTSTFREMDFEESVQSLERDIARTMGVPPILIDGGNQANITPNHRLFYLETILPICRKIAQAFSLYFGYKIVPIEVGVPALQPDLRDLANYVSSLVNGGVMTPNEGREAVGLPKLTEGDSDKIRIPANIAGSANNPSQGGRPKEGEDE